MKLHSLPFRAVSLTLIPAFILTSLPLEAVAGEKKPAPIPPAPKVKVNRTVPKVEPPSPYPVFSAVPTEEEIFRARVFAEPLVPIGGASTPEENQALAAALTSYLRGGKAEAFEPLTGFLKDHPGSVWQASLLTNLGLVYRQTGYFGRALQAFDEAWKLARGESEVKAHRGPGPGGADRDAP